MFVLKTLFLSLHYILDNVKAVIQQPVTVETTISHEPMNFSMNNSFAETTSVSEENNNVIQR